MLIIDSTKTFLHHKIVWIYSVCIKMILFYTVISQTSTCKTTTISGMKSLYYMNNIAIYNTNKVYFAFSHTHHNAHMLQFTDINIKKYIDTYIELKYDLINLFWLVDIDIKGFISMLYTRMPIFTIDLKHTDPYKTLQISQLPFTIFTLGYIAEYHILSDYSALFWSGIVHIMRGPLPPDFSKLQTTLNIKIEECFKYRYNDTSTIYCGIKYLSHANYFFLSPFIGCDLSPRGNHNNIVLSLILPLTIGVAISLCDSVQLSINLQTHPHNMILIPCIYSYCAELSSYFQKWDQRDISASLIYIIQDTFQLRISIQYSMNPTVTFSTKSIYTKSKKLVSDNFLSFSISAISYL